MSAVPSPSTAAVIDGYLRDAAAHRSDAPRVSAFLDAVIASNGAAIATPEQRRSATRETLALLGGTGNAALRAVTALKTLGRTAAGTEDLASDEGVRTLVSLAGLDSPDRASTAIDPKGLPPIAAEATRCLANVCLLHEPARLRFSSVPGIAEGILHGLGPAVPAATRFLSARLLFLCTVSGGDTVRHLVEDLDIARILSARLREYAVPPEALMTADASASANANANARAEADILVEYLKIVFNLSLFYPRLANATEAKIEDHVDGSAAAGGGTSPSKRDNKMLSPDPNKPEGSSSGSSVMSASRSRSPSPSNGRPHSPSPGLPSAPAGEQPRTRQKSSRSDKIKGLFSRSSASANKPLERETSGEAAGSGRSAVWEDEADVLSPWGFESVVAELVRLALCLPLGSGSGFSGAPFGTYKHVITSLLNFNLSAYASLVFVPLSPPNAPLVPALPTTSMSPGAPAPRVPPFPARLLALLDDTCSTYIPYGPDDQDSREAALAAPESLDECLGFLILLLAKCATEDTEGDARRAMRQCLLADEIDRSIGLEKRKDLTGRLMRLMSSTYLSSSGDAAGKLLFALCDQDPSTFAGVLGYGNASGFLQNIGMLVPPSSVPSHFESGADVNPITGAVHAPTDESEADRMTDDEKEREAERLFVLFDRLNRNGAISVENPVRAAQQSGKFAGSAQPDREEGTRFQGIEDEEEKEALEEIRRYKERKAKR